MFTDDDFQNVDQMPMLASFRLQNIQSKACSTKTETPRERDKSSADHQLRWSSWDEEFREGEKGDDGTIERRASSVQTRV